MSIFSTIYETLLSYTSYKTISWSVPVAMVLNQFLTETNYTNTYTVTRKDFINPDNTMGINFADPNKLLWVIMKSIAIKEQVGIIRPNQPSIVEDTDSTVYTFKFLAPVELIETLTHSWEPYESIGQSIQQLIGSVMIKGGSVLGALKTAGYEEGSNIWNAIKSFEGKEIVKTMGQATTTLLGSEKVKPWRVDVPLVYKNTERRVYELPFNLISLQGKPYDEVVEPVKMLEKLSSPTKPKDAETGWNPLVIPPYVFRIYTLPYSGDPEGGNRDNLIRIPFAALKNINPVWKGPYVDGYPTRCELRLSFQEIEPVFSASFLTKTYVNVYTYPHSPYDIGGPA
jgi:hypothetical protein